MVEIELRLEDHRGSALYREAHDDGKAVDVEERHHCHRHVGAITEVGEPRPALKRIRDERAVREHRALGDAGRAAGVLSTARSSGPVPASNGSAGAESAWRMEIAP